MITSKILADSVNPFGVRLTSILMTYPRMIHAELLTHRVFSRNSSSSRAIPVKKMIQAIRDNPALPVRWGKNQKGMQAKDALGDDVAKAALSYWRGAAYEAAHHAERLAEMGVHKQIANRPTEPFGHITVLVTATEWDNYFSLRAHEDAQDEFMALSYLNLTLYLHSKPKLLDWGEWHLPFGDKCEGLDEETKLKIVTARCARTSHLNHDGTASVEDDMRLHDDLKARGHMSPFEHPAQACKVSRQSNFGPGWEQYRKQIPTENRTQADLDAILNTKPDWIKLAFSPGMLAGQVGDWRDGE